MITALDKITALVLIDLQKGITANALAKPIHEILENAAKLVAAFRKAGLPIVVVNVNPAGAKWLTARKELNTMPNKPVEAESLQIVPEIKTEPGDIFITKHTWGAFFETALHEELQKRNVTGIVLGGVSTSIGVEGTARQASEFGYNIAFAKDAMTDRVTDAHEHSLKYIFPRIGEIDDTEKIIEMVK
jgi:nicotinamidase-related amidase